MDYRTHGFALRRDIRLLRRVKREWLTRVVKKSLKTKGFSLGETGELGGQEGVSSLRMLMTILMGSAMVPFVSGSSVCVIMVVCYCIGLVLVGFV
jgi:hypothetical protein